MTIFRFSTVLWFLLLGSACSHPQENEKVVTEIAQLRESVDDLSQKIDAMKDQQDAAIPASTSTAGAANSLSSFEPSHLELSQKLDKIDSDVQSVKNELAFMR
jgi:outer membrane murein-binding lipoprotein Lpp